MLDVPYFKQINDSACGAAALQMVYKFLRPSKLSAFSQQKIFRKLVCPAATDPTKGKINSDDIISAAVNRKLHAKWGRVSLEPQERLEQLTYFLTAEVVPIIACQRFTAEEPKLGHFRVLLAADANSVTFHDPHPQTGGEGLTWAIDKFVDFWRFTSPDVTGGVAIWIADRELQSPLDPDQPNRWAEAEQP